MQEMKSKRRPRRYSEHDLNKLLHESFHSWFADHALKVLGEEISPELRTLAFGPSKWARRYKAYIFNGTRFHTKSRELKRKTQNSGISTTSKTRSYASRKDNNPVEVIIMGRSKRKLTTIHVGESCTEAHLTTETNDVNVEDTSGNATRKRTKTQLEDIWKLPKVRRIPVEANRNGQPIGEEAQSLSSYSGVLVRSLSSYTLLQLTNGLINQWPKS